MNQKVNSKSENYSDYFFIKTNRVFTSIRKYAWIFLIIVAGGGLWFPKLGLLLVPVMISLMVLGFLKGKYWCGNFCPHGSLFDYVILPISKNRNIPKFFRSNIFVIIMFTWFMVMLGIRLKKVFAIFGSASFIDKLGFVFVLNYLVVTVAGLVLAVFFTPRTWCSFCPMGTMSKLTYKLGKKLKVNVKTDKKVSVEHEIKCHTCGKCARVCPMQLKPYEVFDTNHQFDDENCIRCETCVENCPADILSMDDLETSASKRKSSDISGYEKRKRYKAVISEIKSINEDVKEFTFSLLNNGIMDYKSGQFILIKIQDKPEMFRAYSISSDGHDNKTVKVTVKKISRGYGTSIIFNTFEKGKIIEIEGPLGNELVLRNDNDKIIFIGGGIGITPFLSLVNEALKKSAKEINLIHGVSLQKDFIYDDYFKSLSEKYKNFNYIPVSVDNNFSGKKGLVTDVLKDLEIDDEHSVYMCGPKPMIDATKKVLEAKNVGKEKIFFESA